MKGVTTVPSDGDPDPAWAAWYDQREAGKVERAVGLIRVYQFKMPDGIGPWRRGPWPRDWWAEFWNSLERTTEEREEFFRLWDERNLPGGRQAELSGYLEMAPSVCRYKRHGQQKLADFEGGASS